MKEIRDLTDEECVQYCRLILRWGIDGLDNMSPLESASVKFFIDTGIMNYLVCNDILGYELLYSKRLLDGNSNILACNVITEGRNIQDLNLLYYDLKYYELCICKRIVEAYRNKEPRENFSHWSGKGFEVNIMGFKELESDNSTQNKQNEFITDKIQVGAKESKETKKVLVFEDIFTVEGWGLAIKVMKGLGIIDENCKFIKKVNRQIIKAFIEVFQSEGLIYENLKITPMLRCVGEYLGFTLIVHPMKDNEGKVKNNSYEKAKVKKVLDKFR